MKRNVKYKVLIAVIFLVALAALIAGFFLSRNGDGEIRSAYDYSTTVTRTTTKKANKDAKSSDKTKTSSDKTTASADKTTDKTTGKKVVVPGAYVGILNKYQDALADRIGTQALLKAGLSPLLTEMYEGTAQKNVGFYIDDFNKDGTTDLLIGVIDGYRHFPYAILDYYTLDNNGKAFNVFQSQPKDYYAACTNARILEKASDGKMYTAWYFYGLNSNGMKLTFKEGLLRDRYSSEKKPWYSASDLDGDTSNDRHIKTEAGEKRQKQLDETRVQLDFTPFSRYDRTNKVK
ncbi:MAG: hypothetical protein J5847_01900 [Clostridia bacterium]|nr:hypothetical protein [Clostridia bacterium]